MSDWSDGDREQRCVCAEIAGVHIIADHMPTTTGRILDLLADAVTRAKLDGLDSAVSWTWFQCMSRDEHLAFDLFLVRMGDELAWQPGSPESRFRERVRRMLTNQREEAK